MLLSYGSDNYKYMWPAVEPQKSLYLYLSATIYPFFSHEYWKDGVRRLNIPIYFCSTPLGNQRESNRALLQHAICYG